jgi:hypothetical protein
MQWANLNTAEWWSFIAGGGMPNRKAMASITLLVAWEVWNERNARVFRAKSAPAQVVFDKIKHEARLWVLAGAKNMGNIMPRE